MTKVTLRRKPISKDRHSLYLDYYPPVPHPETGKLTRREFLSIYVYNTPKTLLDKAHNKETLALAENIRARRQLDVQNQRYGFLSFKQHVPLLTYYREQASKRSGSSAQNWQSSLHFLSKFFHEGVRLSELTLASCNDYKAYLLRAKSQRGKASTRSISINTAHSYFNKFKATLRQAYREDLLRTDLNAKIAAIKSVEPKREFLTLEELQRLYETDCVLPLLKRAALFSALTGLRFSDIQQLQWGDVQHSMAEGHYLRFRQQKTQLTEMLPVSEQAIQLLETRGADSRFVFQGLEYSAYNNGILRDWVKAARINKHITFHCFRHTFATLQLSCGTDIYTVSKLLGHRELKTTQIYAKVIDHTKREAADRIKLNMN